MFAQRTFRVTAFAIWLSLATVIVGLTEHVAAFPPTATTVPPGELSELMLQFQSASSLKYGADVELTFGPIIEHGLCAQPVPETSLSVPIAGRFEFKAADARYLMVSHMDPAHMPWMQTEAAYDGAKFQLIGADGTLSLEPADSASILPALPNPLQQLLQFRYPITDANSDWEFRIQDVWNDQVPVSFWNVSWTLIEDAGLTRERAVFPGGVYEGRSYVHHVIAPATRRRTPVRIDRIDDQGMLLTSSEFTDYRRADTSAGAGYWPHRIVLKSYAEENVLAGQIAYTVTELAIDEPVLDNEFVIPENHAERVWNGFQQSFVSTGGQ